MTVKKHSKLFSLLLCILIFVAHFDAITATAAPLGDIDSSKIIGAIQNTEQGNVQKFYSNLTGGSTVYIRSFRITNLEAPTNGRLLDNTATIVADNGVSWDIPVIWVNKDGDIIHIAIEIDDIIRSYPIFVFYMPKGYSFIFGEKAGYNIEMPDFVVSLMRQNGVTALSIPEAGRTYISTLLPETTDFKINVESNVDSSSTTSDGNMRDPYDDGNPPEAPKAPDNPTTPDDPSVPNDPPAPDDPTIPDVPSVPDDPTVPDDPVTPAPIKPDPTPPTDNEKAPPDSGLSAAEKVVVTNAHCDGNVIGIIGVEKLADLIVWVKKTLEPEAVNLLESKFPAYEKAVNNDEIGKDIGLYIFYDDYENPNGTTEDYKDFLATVNTQWWYYQPGLEYRVNINAKYFYEKDAAGDWQFVPDKAYSDLDNTLVHEMMHAYMDDYTRAGMTGIQYDKENNTYYYEDKGDTTGVCYPQWFVEGIASTVTNNFQFRYDNYHYEMQDDNGNKIANYGYNWSKNTYVSDDLKSNYQYYSQMQLDDDSYFSKYVSGYLACAYLGYLASVSKGNNAITGSSATNNLRVDSEVIRDGLNDVLTKLHEGKTLDDVIREISGNGSSQYSGTKDFEEKFISGTNDTSLAFCVDLLNYLQNCSSGTDIANGSILLDFSDTNTAQLHLSLLNQPQEAFVPTDSRDFVYSTVDENVALNGGGTSEKGILTSGSSLQIAQNAEIVAGTVAAQTSANEKNIEQPVLDDCNSESKKAQSIADAISLAIESNGATEEYSNKACDIERENSDLSIDSEKTSEQLEANNSAEYPLDNTQSVADAISLAITLETASATEEDNIVDKSAVQEQDVSDNSTSSTDVGSPSIASDECSNESDTLDGTNPLDSGECKEDNCERAQNDDSSLSETVADIDDNGCTIISSDPDESHDKNDAEQEPKAENNSIPNEDQSSLPVSEDVQDEEVVYEVLLEPETEPEAEQNTLIISEAPSEEEESKEDTTSNEILDAIPEPSTDENNDETVNDNIDSE
ncbi:hypothetical protein [Butyrivibrio sp. XBB1001]|uniref:hypothetical protein n=1 Tax=Butyrivibrio sp. XBB1001 TaxID=1280682 RepID=UPI00041128DB|nr:hypothetical protein [Butyrivibrio sp. XBB1001]